MDSLIFTGLGTFFLMITNTRSITQTDFRIGHRILNPTWLSDIFFPFSSMIYLRGFSSFRFTLTISSRSLDQYVAATC